MRIVIAGGGLAGLAAAVALTERGLPCEILESRPRLGGRASSFLDPTTDTYIDNCQHVSLGCCTNFRHFCESTGLAQFFRREATLYFIGPTGKVDPFSATSLPAPLHLAGAFARLSYLSWRDKFSLARGLKALARGVRADERSLPFSEWLARHGQSRAAIDRFWHVVLVSALSETLDRIDVEHARKVFVDTFLAHRDGWFVEIPTAPLEELYGGRLTEWLTSRGTTIRLQTAVEQIELHGDRVAAVRLSSGERLDGDEFIVALPFFRVRSILPESLAAHPDLAGIERLEAAPISSVHLWFDRPITKLPHAVFVDRLCQWMFNRTALGNIEAPSGGREPPGSACSGQEPGGSRPTLRRQEVTGEHYYQIVISASRELTGQSREAILAQVLAELTAVWPDTARATLLHSRQVTEHRAVFSPLPGVDQWRPMQQSPVGNLQFAGDWTRTGWPATMEGAVRSGYLAAANVLARLNRAEPVVQPDLPVSVWSRLLMGVPLGSRGQVIRSQRSGHQGPGT
jgi:squalene-associated FAD-dependent desaturase